jgi:hypothetical protein
MILINCLFFGAQGLIYHRLPLISLEPFSKVGFWFKLAAGPSFPALRDFPSDQIFFVGRKPQAYCSYVEDLKRDTNKDIGPKDIFEIGSGIKGVSQMEGSKSEYRAS